jgi:hypothetical protein
VEDDRSIVPANHHDIVEPGAPLLDECDYGTAAV